MADKRDTLKLILAADPMLTSILTGGILDRKDTGKRGLTTQNIPQDANGVVKPFAFVKWSSGNRFGSRKQRGIKRSIEIYVHDNDDHLVIEDAIERIIELIDDVYLDSDDTGLFFLEHTFESDELVATHLNDIPMQFVRFQASIVRT